MTWRRVEVSAVSLHLELNVGVANSERVGQRAPLLRGRTHLRDAQIYWLSPFIQIAKNPTHCKVLGLKIIADYGATDFIGAIQQYVQPFSPMFADMVHEEMAFSVWSWVTLHHDRLPFAPLARQKIDHVRASPPSYNQYN